MKAPLISGKSSITARTPFRFSCSKSCPTSRALKVRPFQLCRVARSISINETLPKTPIPEYTSSSSCETTLRKTIQLSRKLSPQLVTMERPSKNKIDNNAMMKP